MIEAAIQHEMMEAERERNSASEANRQAMAAAKRKQVVSYRYPSQPGQGASLYVSLALGSLIGGALFVCYASGGGVAVVAAIVAVAGALAHTAYVLRVLT